METELPREKVAVVKYDGTSNALKRAVELCGGFGELKPDHKILLKPNIIWGGTNKLPPFGVVKHRQWSTISLSFYASVGARILRSGRALSLYLSICI